jgi:hypothetical protein
MAERAGLDFVRRRPARLESACVMGLQLLPDVIQCIAQFQLVIRPPLLAYLLLARINVFAANFVDDQLDEMKFRELVLLDDI